MMPHELVRRGVSPSHSAATLIDSICVENAKDNSNNLLEQLSNLLSLQLVSLLFGGQVRKLRIRLKPDDDMDKSRL